MSAPPPPSYASTNPNTPPGYPSDKKNGYPSEKRMSYVSDKGSSSRAPATSALYACVLLSSSDRLRFLNFPANIPNVVQGILQHAWPPGIQQRFQLEYGGMEFKLKGNPWWGQGSEAVPARRLLIHVFHGLACEGWHLAAAADLTKKSWDKDTLFFRAGPPIQRVFFSISFNETDKVRLIDSPSPAVTDAFMGAVRAWPLGVQSEKAKEYGCYQVKLRGTPWLTSNGSQVSHARILALNILTVMDNLGFELAGSIDMSSSGGEDSRDLDSWFFASKI